MLNSKTVALKTKLVTYRRHVLATLHRKKCLYFTYVKAAFGTSGFTLETKKND